MHPAIKAYFDYLKEGHNAAPPPSILIPYVKALEKTKVKIQK
jgi:hypothetical protein